MPVPDPPAGFSYFGYGNGLPYCIDDYFVTGEIDDDYGVILEQTPPDGGWGIYPPTRIYAGFDNDFVTLNQAFNLTYNISEVTLSSSFTLLGYETEFTVPTKYRVPSWGDQEAAFNSTVTAHMEAGYPEEFAISYGDKQYREPLEEDPYWDYTFARCSTTTSPSLDDGEEGFEGTSQSANYDYYDVRWNLATGAGRIIRIVDKDDYTPTGFYLVSACVSFYAYEDSNNSLGEVQIDLSTGHQNGELENVNVIKSFTIDDPVEGDYTVYATTYAPLYATLVDESGNTVTIDSFKFREYT